MLEAVSGSASKRGLAWCRIPPATARCHWPGVKMREQNTVKENWERLSGDFFSSDLFSFGFYSRLSFRFLWCDRLLSLPSFFIFFFFICIYMFLPFLSYSYYIHLSNVLLLYRYCTYGSICTFAYHINHYRLFHSPFTYRFPLWFTFFSPFLVLSLSLPKTALRIHAN